MTSPINIEMLSELINQQIQLLEKLDSALSEEHSQLTLKRIDDLEALASLKLSLLGELHQLEKKQAAHLASIGSSPTLNSLLTQLDKTSSLTFGKLVDRLNTLANACSDQNRVNGIMIHARQRANQHILSLLHNQTTEDVTTYGKKGETACHTSSMTRAKA